MYKVISLQISDSIDIKAFRAAFTAELIYSDSSELCYKTEQDKFVYIFKYGVVSFLNQDAIKLSEFIQFIQPYCSNFFESKLKEEFDIEVNAVENKIGYNKIEITAPEEEIFRLIMLNVSQSVALDYYSEQTSLLLKETNRHTLILEQTGNLRMSAINLKKFIGKTLNLMNRITENLYIFDSPEETWEDENLNKIDIGLKRTFDLQSRYRSIHEELQIVKENLSLFKDILHHRKSNVLEWIIILLILIEVLNLFWDKVLSH
jgi:required for meiotic nuclear division protein 1